jgi:hypothetical protein
MMKIRENINRNFNQNKEKLNRRLVEFCVSGFRRYFVGMFLDTKASCRYVEASKSFVFRGCLSKNSSTASQDFLQLSMVSRN